MSKRVLPVKPKFHLREQDLGRKASLEAGGKILLQSQGMEAQGENVEDENSRWQMQTVHKGLRNRQESLRGGQEWRIQDVKQRVMKWCSSYKHRIKVC